MQLTRQQQQQFGQRMNDELERITMSWDNDLRAWHPIAIEALAFGSAPSLQIPQNMFGRLLLEETHGLNMNVVMALCNNLEARTPKEMGVPVHKWGNILELNHAIATRWDEMVMPINKKITKEFEIMANKPAMGIITAEA